MSSSNSSIPRFASVATSSSVSNQMDSKKLCFLCQFWPDIGLTEQDVGDESYNAFFDYVNQEIRILGSCGEDFAAQCLEGTAALVSKLREHKARSKMEILEDLQKDFPNASNSSIERSMELALRLWLTLTIRSSNIAVGPVNAAVTQIEWPGQKSLTSLVQDQFVEQVSPVPEGKARLQADSNLTAASLVRIYSIQIIWTNNLADHLELHRMNRTLKIYQHKICLINHAAQATIANSVFSLPVLEEAIDTMNLLFPIGDEMTTALLLKEGKMLHTLGNYHRAPRTNLARYVYWREQLMELVDFVQEPARNWRQFRSRPRSLTESATFWNLCIAIVVILLTLISIGFGTAQTVFSVKQYKVSVLQLCQGSANDLALKDLCK